MLCRRRCSPRPAARGCAGWSPATRPPAGSSTGSSPARRLDDALAAVRALRRRRLAVTLDHLGEDITDRAEATRTRDAYLALLEALAPLRPRAGAPRCRSSCRRSARRCRSTAHDIALRAGAPGRSRRPTAMGTTVTLDMEDHTTVDSTLAVLAELRKRAPRHRRRAAGDAASAPRTTPGPRRHRLPGAAGQGRLQRAGRPSRTRTKTDVDAAYAALPARS